MIIGTPIFNIYTNNEGWAILEIYRVLKKDGMCLIEGRNHRSGKLIAANMIDGYDAMPSYNHTTVMYWDKFKNT